MHLNSHKLNILDVNGTRPVNLPSSIQVVFNFGIFINHILEHESLQVHATVNVT